MVERWECISPDDYTRIISIYHYLESLSNEYPHFEQWYFGKVIPQLKLSKRMIKCLSIDEEIAGLIILKNTEDEKKISTLRVSPKFQGIGIGQNLLNWARFSLHCTSPLVTVPQVHYEAFAKLFERNGFILCKEYHDYYKKGGIEFSYNGYLTEPKDRFLAQNERLYSYIYKAGICGSDSKWSKNG